MTAVHREPVSRQGAVVFEFDGVRVTKLVFAFQVFAGGFGDLNGAGFAGRFQAAGGVDGLAPDIVGEGFAADHPGDQRAGVDADANLERGIILLVQPFHRFLESNRQLGDGVGVVGLVGMNAAGDHVGVSDDFDFLQAAFFDEDIKGLGTEVKVLNIVVVPFIFAVLVLLIAVWRRKQRRVAASNKENNP